MPKQFSGSLYFRNISLTKITSELKFRNCFGQKSTGVTLVRPISSGSWVAETVFRFVNGSCHFRDTFNYQRNFLY